MPQAKRASRGKRPSKTVSVLGIAGVSLAASTGGSPAEMPSASLAAPTAGSVANIWQNTASFQVPSLDEEEISDVSLATFHLFDKEDLGNSQSGVQLAAFRGGCGCGHGCGGCRGCGGFRGCGGGCRGWLWRLPRLPRWRLRRWLSRLRLGVAAAAVAAAAGAGVGAAAAACRGEVAPSGARLERLAITLTDARRHARI